MQDDSSSEETPNIAAGNKPVVPPRPRNLGFDHKSKVNNNAPNAATPKQRAGGLGDDYETAECECQSRRG